MFNILTNLYLVHQNVFAFVILLAITAIIFAVKHNYKIALIVGVLFVVANIGCYKMTNNSTWEREFMLSDEFPTSYTLYESNVDSIPVIEFKDSTKFEFNPTDRNKWVVKGIDSTKTEHLLHWCWIDDKWENFSKIDLVAGIWGENAGKKIRGSSEKRLNYTTE